MAFLLAVSGVVNSALPTAAQAEDQATGLPWWAWLLIVVVLAALLVWWLGRRPAATIEPTAPAKAPGRTSDRDSYIETPPAVERTAAPIPSTTAEVAPIAAVESPSEPAVEAPSAATDILPATGLSEPTVEPVVTAAEPAPRPDDLTVIEGIGPKIAALLAGAGIRTFAQLADTDVDRLRQMLLEVGYRVADPGTWPEQARLAAAGNWGELQAMQHDLKGGRRV